MNHWVSKHTSTAEQCAACSEPVPNAGESRNVQITGRCPGSPPLEEDLKILCGSCLGKPPFLGKYKPSTWDDRFVPHAGFCEQCRSFVGDGGYLALPPQGVSVSLGRHTRTPLWGIWCTHPSLAPRWVPHEDPLLECPKPFGSKEEAEAFLYPVGAGAPLLGHGALQIAETDSNWTFEAKLLSEGT